LIIGEGSTFHHSEGTIFDEVSTFHHSEGRRFDEVSTFHHSEGPIDTLNERMRPTNPENHWNLLKFNRKFNQKLTIHKYSMYLLFLERIISTELCENSI